MPHIASLSGFQVATPSLSRRLADSLGRWKIRAQERHELAKFTALDLKDIGMTESERTMHLAKPIWRA